MKIVNIRMAIAAALVSVAVPVMVFADTATVAADGGSCAILDDMEGPKCPSCPTVETTKEVEVNYETSTGSCTSTSCRYQTGGRWRCDFTAVHPTSHQEIACVVTWTRQSNGTWTAKVNDICKNLGISEPGESNPDFSSVPDLAGLKKKAEEEAKSFCECKPECDKTATCEVKPGHEPKVDDTQGAGGVTGSSTRPRIGGTGSVMGCKGTLTIAVKFQCQGKCERKLHVAGSKEEECAAAVENQIEDQLLVQ